MRCLEDKTPSAVKNPDGGCVDELLNRITEP